MQQGQSRSHIQSQSQSRDQGSETILNGRYRLGEVLGEGGMAVVYRGHDLLLNRPVAVKILRAQYAADENFLKRFEREAQAAASFSHPNIVNVYDVGTDGGQHYIVMEYIRGPSLKELIRRQGPFSVDGAVFIIGQVASALDYAHQRGLVHRDIKPQNILVDRDGNAKVVDFGIAKGSRDVNLTEAGTGMGTVHYVSPEQARGDPATPASDLYSTGVVLFEMLAKRLPFEADTPVGVAMHHVNTDPPPPSTYNPGIPPPVDAIVLKALSKNPSERYPTGAQLATALRHWDLPPMAASERTRRVDPVGPAEPTIAVPRAGGRGATGAVPMPPRAVPAGGRAAPAPRQRSSPMRVAPTAPGAVPPRGGTRGGAYRGYSGGPPPAARANRDDVGCVTWLIGIISLIGIIGLLMLAFQVGPGVFASGDDGDGDDSLAQMTATATSDTGGLVEPTVGPTNTPEPTATVAATMTPQPTEPPATATLTPTVPAPTPIPVAVVPSLVGLTEAQAVAEIGDTWDVSIVREPSSEAPEGNVIRQSPTAGAELVTGETVTIVISQGVPLVSIPDVRGLDGDDAIEQLEGLGFVVTVVEEASEAVDEGEVIRTSPNTEAPAGSTITVVVSSGEADDDVSVVPYVYAQPFQDGVEAMEEAGLTVNRVTPLSCDEILAFDPSFDCDSFPDGAIVTSTLAWESAVPEGSPVDLTYYDASE